MLQLGECDQLLVTDLFADYSSPASSSNDHDISAFPTLNSSEHHPLRRRSVSPAGRFDTVVIPSVTVVGSEGETRPELLGLGRSAAEVAAEGDRITGSVGEVHEGGSDIVMHPVGPNDSFAGVALRYGISIAALRRANQLWPSDPIHLRTELLIPRGDTLRARRKHTQSLRSDATLRCPVASTPDLSQDLVVPSFVAARNMILSVLPARISLDSLSSKASASEDHELDDLREARAHKISAIEVPFSKDGLELTAFATPHAPYRLPVVSPSSNVRSSADSQHTDLNHTAYFGDSHSQPMSSPPTLSIERPFRRSPFAALPVRTSQLGPEPAMELPVRRSHI